MHDGTVVRLRKTHEGYRPTDRASAYAHVRMPAAQRGGDWILLRSRNGSDMHAVAKTVETPLVDLTHQLNSVSNAALQSLMEKYR